MKTPKTNSKSKSANNLEELKQSAKKEFLEAKTSDVLDIYTEERKIIVETVDHEKVNFYIILVIKEGNTQYICTTDGIDMFAFLKKRDDSEETTLIDDDKEAEILSDVLEEFLDVNKIYCLNSKTKTLKDLYNELIYEDDEEEDQK